MQTSNLHVAFSTMYGQMGWGKEKNDKLKLLRLAIFGFYFISMNETIPTPESNYILPTKGNKN